MSTSIELLKKVNRFWNSNFLYASFRHSEELRLNRELSDHLSTNGWFPIESALKDSRIDILVYSEITGELEVARYTSAYGQPTFVASEGILINPTHWQPTPPPPNKV